MFDTYIKWIEAHERLLLVAVAGLVLWFGIGRVDSLIAAHDNANLTQVKVVAQSQADKTAALAAQVEQQSAQYQALATKLDAQNAALVAANTQLATALAQQQRTDAGLPPSELAQRWNTLVPSANVTVSTNGETLPTSGAIATVQSLEQVPVLQKQLGNTQDELKSAQQLLGLSQNENTTLNSEVSSLNVQLKDNQTVCNQQIAVIKAEGRRSKRRWFAIGFVSGFITRQWIKTSTGL
jgi:hypothetical protein